LFFRACFQISAGSSFGVREFLEEFLSKWICVDGQYYVLVGAETNVHCMERCDARFILGVDQYAVSWVENAALPEEKRQVIYILSYI